MMENTEIWTILLRNLFKLLNVPGNRPIWSIKSSQNLNQPINVLTMLFQFSIEVWKAIKKLKKKKMYWINLDMNDLNKSINALGTPEIQD